ncbi:MAG TPA: ThuA domain-containing protein [Terracidiphilus sp.]|nr:ThuA domain-containing protein [Terracidiphilus sp.]
MKTFRLNCFGLTGFVCWAAVLLFSLPMAAQSATKPRVLVYTRNYTPDGKGYVHDNIAASVTAIRKMGMESGFDVDASDDPAVFTTENLQKYAALVFSNSNNEAFSTDAQRDAFRKFIQAGGGFVGIHSASGSERAWPYFWQVLGGKFVKHPRMQTFTVRVTDTSFAAMKGVPKEFTWTDECYFLDHLNPDIHTVLATDRTKLTDLDAMHIDISAFQKELPLAWYQHFDGGREFYIALGHNKEDYENPMFYGILKNGILWAIGPKN